MRWGLDSPGLRITEGFYHTSRGTCVRTLQLTGMKQQYCVVTSKLDVRYMHRDFDLEC